jgi:hypothetical protein
MMAFGFSIALLGAGWMLAILSQAGRGYDPSLKDFLLSHAVIVTGCVIFGVSALR